MHVGVELARERDFSAPLKQDEFATNSQPLPTSPQLWAARQKTLSSDDVKLRRRKLGELCWLATVSRPDICARLARFAARVNSLQGSDVHRINDLVDIAKVWQRATVPKCGPCSHVGKPGRGSEEGEMRRRSGAIHSESMTPEGWSDAAYGEQPALGKCRLGNVIGLMSSTLRVPFFITQWRW